MNRPLFEYGTALLPGYAELFWDVFFRQRGRGFELADHFPWMELPDDAAYATLRLGGQVLAGLTVRSVGVKSAALGLVCVHREHRGRGIASELISSTLQELDRQGATASTLWTGKPDVYAGHGFVMDDEAVIAEVTGWRHTPVATVSQLDNPQVTRWPDAVERQERNRGLPAFATAAQRLSGHGAQVIMLIDPLGTVVVEWQGADEAVLTLLAAVMPPRWRLHALSNDSLLRRLAESGATMTRTASTSQMWRAHPKLRPSARPKLRLLDRI